MRYLPWRKEGRGICGGRGGRDGVAIGMEGNGGGRGGTRRRMEGRGAEGGERDANETRRPCKLRRRRRTGQMDLVRQGIPSCRRQAPVGLVVVGIVVGPVGEVRAFRDRAVLRPDQAVGRDAQFHDGAQRTIPGYDNGHKHHVAVRAVSAGRSNSRTPAEIS